MIGKIAIAAGLWAALQLSVFDTGTEQGGVALAQSGQVQDARCAQAKAYGIDDLRRAGLVIECN